MPSDLGTTAIPDSNIITKFTDYGVLMPDWLIDFISHEIVQRDVRGLTNDIITKLNVSGEHPLVQMTASILNAKTSKFDISGFLPAVSVVEGDENEDPEILGNGYRKGFDIDQVWLDGYKERFPSQKTAIQDGLFTAQQVLEIETFLGTLPEGKQKVLVIMDGFFLKTNLMVGVWCQTVQERSIIGNLIRSILFDSRKYLSAERGIKDIHFKTAKGLVNTNFGMILLGQETTIDFTNYFHNFTVTKEVPLDILNPDGSIDLDILDSEIGYYPAYQFDDNVVKYPGEDNEDIDVPSEIPGTERSENE